MRPDSSNPPASLHIWLVRDLDPLPIDGGSRRLMRSAFLADALVARGHTVRWITSSFDHYRKTHRPTGRFETGPDGRLVVEVLPGRGYDKNISLARVLHNRAFAALFSRFALTLERPNLIAVDIPTTEAAAAAVRYARRNGIPSMLSIRDLWPDFFLDYTPPSLRPLVRPLVAVLDAQSRFACRNATALVGISPGYLDWGRRKGARAPVAADRVVPLGYKPLPSAAPKEEEARLRALGIDPKKKIVSFVGSWGATYDLELIRAASTHLSHRDDIVFAITGDGAARPALRDAFAALSNVSLTGWIGANDIAALLRHSSIGLLPYGAAAPQGLPNKVFEYMAYGVYQVATLTGELTELYAETETGTVAPDRNPATFARLIEKSLDDPAVAAARANRLAIFAMRFDADTVYGQLATHFEAVAQGLIWRDVQCPPSLQLGS